MPWHLVQGKAALKHELASQTTFYPSTLPYNMDLLAWLKAEKANGRTIILCTASHVTIATAIAKHLDLFDEVIASDQHINLSGRHKAALLVTRYGNAGFDYVGNSKSDLAVWEHARYAIVVNASNRLVRQVRQLCDITHIFKPMPKGLSVWQRLLRTHQWLKNLLLLLPLLASHQYFIPRLWYILLPALLAFCLCASAVYMINDLLDLCSDRAHPRKCHRPFAAGQVSIKTGLLQLSR